MREKISFRADLLGTRSSYIAISAHMQ